jgi:6-phospho-beta-glucosidase
MKTLVILGGGSPYTLQLCEQLAKSRLGDEPWQLRLQGRNPTVTAQIARYARARLPSWKVSNATTAQAVLEGADYVIHQARYGGLDGRHKGESLGRALGVAADETLGPAGLLAAIDCKLHIAELATLLQCYCPDAWVLNITNPLSITTSLFFLHNHPRCIGICELPTVTQHQIAAHLGLPHKHLQWAYTGFNHRGFLHDLRFNGQTVLPRLLSILGKQDLMGINSTLIEELEAVPTKYFRLLMSSKVDDNDRSTELADLRTQILEQLQETPLRYPPALEQRQMPWYEHAVVPLLGALSGSRQPCVMPVNLCGSDGITREFLATVNTDGVNENLPRHPPPHAVEKWMETFHKHETASLSACLDPVPEKIKAAFATDPLMGGCKLKTAVSTFQTYLAGNAHEHA